MKKLSSLCLALVLSISVVLDLSTNATLEDIGDCHLTQEEITAIKDIYGLDLTKEEIAALEGKGTNSLPAEQIEKLENINSLNERELADVVADCYNIRSYVAKECYFSSLLRKIGKDEMADDYEEYSKQFDRQFYYKYNIGFANLDLILKEIDDIVYQKAVDFFNERKFRPDPSDLKAVAVYALIHEMNFEEAMEILA